MRPGAREERDRCWTALGLHHPYATLPERPQDFQLLFLGLAQASDKNAYLAEVFAHRGDRLPPSRAELLRRVGRAYGPMPKLFHRLGTCAKVSLRGASGYGGMLADGAVSHGICRASIAARGQGFSPGIALKWPVDGGDSVNLLANHSFAGFADRQGFFGGPVRTVLDPPTSGLFDAIAVKAAAHALAGVFQGALAWWRRDAGPVPPDPLVLDLSEVCAGGEAPRFLVFQPTSRARTAYRGSGAADFAGAGRRAAGPAVRRDRRARGVRGHPRARRAVRRLPRRRPRPVLPPPVQGAVTPKMPSRRAGSATPRSAARCRTAAGSGATASAAASAMSAIPCCAATSSQLAAARRSAIASRDAARTCASGVP
ncbi:MAG: hypothetical protein R3F59_12610 [Myxococcota bacterium]